MREPKFVFIWRANSGGFKGLQIGCIEACMIPGLLDDAVAQALRAEELKTGGSFGMQNLCTLSMRTD